MIVYFNDIFAKFLSGFHKKYGDQSSLPNIVENWKSSIKAGEFVGTVGIDLSKEFDYLPHSLLIVKFTAHGFHYSACKLTTSYLHNGSQCVKHSRQKCMLRCCQLTLLYLYQWHLFIDLSCAIYNYADGNCISYLNTNVDCLQSVLIDKINSLMACLKLNSLEPNPNKFKSMLISRSAKTMIFRMKPMISCHYGNCYHVEIGHAHR